MRIGWRLGLVVALVGTAACGSGTTSGTAAACDGGCPQLTSADEDFLDKFCGLVEGCCVANFARPAPDVAGCKRQVSENGFSRDPAVQSACLSELQGLASAGIACFPDLGDLTDPCARIYYEPSGSHQPGEACTVVAACAGAPGTITRCINGCLRLTPGQAGDGVCLGNVDVDGTISAAPMSVPGTNQIISTGVVCERRAGLHCTFASDPTTQTCQPLAAGGAACSIIDPLACASKTCSEPPGATSDSCAAIASAGQACDASTVCDDGSYCSNSGSTTAICMAKTPVGGSCTTATMCASGASCANGVCPEGLVVLGFCGRTYP